MAQVLQILGAIPQILSLVKELKGLWGVLSKRKKDYDLKQFFRDTAKIMRRLQDANSAEDRQKSARSIADIISDDI